MTVVVCASCGGSVCDKHKVWDRVRELFLCAGCARTQGVEK